MQPETPKELFSTQFGTKFGQTQPEAPEDFCLIQFGTKSGQMQPEALKSGSGEILINCLIRNVRWKILGKISQDFEFHVSTL
jgi:hypothetical protein